MSFHRVIHRSGDFTTLPAAEWASKQFGPGLKRDYAGRHSNTNDLIWYNSGFWFYFKNEEDATLFALKWG